MRALFGHHATGRAAVALLILRLVFGLGIAAHGWQKFRAGWTHWFGPGGIPAPWQAAATLAEFCGGIGILVGLLTPLAALAVVCTMSFALYKVHLPAHEPYVSLSNGPDFEVCLHYFGAALAILFAGPGVCSLDYLLFRRRWRKNPYAP